MKPVSVQRSLESAGRLTAALLARGAVKHCQYSSNFRETLLILVMSETDKNTNNSSGSVGRIWYSRSRMCIFRIRGFMIYPRGFTFVSPDDKAKIILRQSQQSKSKETGLIWFIWESFDPALQVAWTGRWQMVVVVVGSQGTRPSKTANDLFWNSLIPLVELLLFSIKIWNKPKNAKGCYLRQEIFTWL